MAVPQAIGVPEFVDGLGRRAMYEPVAIGRVKSSNGKDRDAATRVGLSKYEI